MTVSLSVSPGVRGRPLLGKTWATIQETSQDSRPDTVAFMKMKGKYYMPNTVGAGISYVHQRQGRFMVEADFTWGAGKAANILLYIWRSILKWWCFGNEVQQSSPLCGRCRIHA